MDGDDTKMKLENLAENRNRREKSRLSIISRVLGRRFSVIAVSCVPRHGTDAPPISRMVVQYLESLQRIRSETLASIRQTKCSFRRTSCLSHQQQQFNAKPAGGRCLRVTVTGHGFRISAMLSFRGKDVTKCQVVQAETFACWLIGFK